MTDSERTRAKMDPAKLGESIRSSAEALQQSGTFDEMLKEANSENEKISFYERHLIDYIEKISNTETEMPIAEVQEQNQLVNVQELRNIKKEANK